MAVDFRMSPRETCALEKHSPKAGLSILPGAELILKVCGIFI